MTVKFNIYLLFTPVFTIFKFQIYVRTRININGFQILMTKKKKNELDDKQQLS